MDRETWLRILQITVLAPYLYSRSEDEDNAYFRLGLKMIAGSILILNVPPLLQKAQPLFAAAAKLQQDAMKMSAIEKANASEAEYI